MKTFKQFLEEKSLTTAALAGIISGAAMAAPPKEGAAQMAANLISSSEGYRKNAYIDQIGKGTPKPISIGYGTTHNYPDTGEKIQLGDTVDKKRATDMLALYMQKDYKNLEKIPGWDDMSSHQQAALMSFSYNFGNFYQAKKGFKDLNNALANKNWDEIPSHLEKFNKGTDPNDPTKKVVYRGLVTRRAKEIDLWNTKSEPRTEPATTQVQPQAEPATTQVQPQAEPSPTTIHTVSKGDNLTKIAEKYKTTVQEIIKKNPDIKDPNRITPGQKINY